MFQTLRSSAYLFLFCLVLTLSLGVALSAQTPGGLDGQTVSEASLAAEMDSAAMLAGEPGTGPTGAPDPKTTSQDQPDPNKLKVAIYPVLGWAPIFGANIHLPDTPSTPGGGSGSTNNSFNGAALFGLTVEKGRWWGGADVMWAGLSASRSNPVVNTTLNAVYGEGDIGYKFWRDLYFTGGFRRIALDYKVTLGSFPQFERKPGVWDPMIGLMWNQQLNKKWKIRLATEGGGFGVGSQIDYSASGMADWMFAKHFGVAFGWSLLYLNESNTDNLGHTFKASTTINGPTFGFGIYF